MRKKLSVFVVLSLVSTVAVASTGFQGSKGSTRVPSSALTPGMVIKKLQGNDVVLGIHAYAKKGMGTNAACGPIVVESLDRGSFKAKSSCIGRDQDGSESTLHFTIKGSLFETDGEPLLQSVTFSFAG